MKAVEQLEYTIEEWDDEDQHIVEVLARIANALPGNRGIRAVQGAPA